MTATPAPPPADLYAAVKRAGARRSRALKRADAELDVIVAQVALVLTTGVPVNKERVAREAGISKRTLYDRLEKAGVPLDADPGDDDA